jgi:hypothetical protein
MARFCLMYRNPQGRRVGVVILDSDTLSMALQRVRMEGIAQEVGFCGGYELDKTAAALIPTAALDHVLDRGEIFELIGRIEHGPPKPPSAAASIKRNQSVKR